MKKDEEIKLLKERIKFLESPEAEHLSAEETFSKVDFSDELTGNQAKKTRRQFKYIVDWEYGGEKLK